MAGSSLRVTHILFNVNKAGTIRRSISSQTSRKSDVASQNVSVSYSHDQLSSAPTSNLPQTPPRNTKMPKAPLAILPLSAVIRSLAVTTISSSFLLRPSLSIMSILAHSHNPILNPDRNRLLRWTLKKTFYAQFCAGENAKEVIHTVKGLKDLGYKGVILGYAKEVVMDDNETSALKGCEDTESACIENEILPWKQGTLDTVALAGPDDFVALK